MLLTSDSSRIPAHEPTRAAQRFFRKSLKACHNQSLRVINVDQNAAYPKAVDELKAVGILPESCELRPIKYLNNIVEQNHRSIKRLVKPGLGFKSFHTAWQTIRGYETMNMMRKGRSSRSGKGRHSGQVRFIAKIFGLAA